MITVWPTPRRAAPRARPASRRCRRPGRGSSCTRARAAPARGCASALVTRACASSALACAAAICGVDGRALLERALAPRRRALCAALRVSVAAASCAAAWASGRALRRRPRCQRVDLRLRDGVVLPQGLARGADRSPPSRRRPALSRARLARPAICAPAPATDEAVAGERRAAVESPPFELARRRSAPARRRLRPARSPLRARPRASFTLCRRSRSGRSRRGGRPS